MRQKAVLWEYVEPVTPVTPVTPSMLYAVFCKADAAKLSCRTRKRRMPYGKNTCA